jgi:cellulose synthase/poly-beta-1,6-N-acetylglucosamine synthase-like glycosyltransferase
VLKRVLRPAIPYDEPRHSLPERLFGWINHVTASAIILSILLFIIINFYIFASLVNFNRFFYIFLILSLLTDGLFMFIHLLRRETNHEKISLDPSKVSVVIACYNGEDVIGETVKQCLRHVPPGQIIVVSDASTDNTAEVARSYGVKVIVNKKNLHKAQSVHEGVKKVKTPYVLLLDDDVLIGKAVIPTSLLDEGYTAVAFNVMPAPADTLVNTIQRFEYRNSMNIGKSLRGTVGAVGNVSGAIGLYRTEDLLEQQTLHSGQFAGEDEQRTILSHMYGTGKGVTYTDETVLTLVPASFYALYRQRAYSWSLAVPELFTLYWRIILSPRYHFLLKAEKAYYLYIYLTDPLRLLFLWALVLRPQQLLMTYVLYLGLDILVWFKTKRRDHFFVVLLYPLYTLWLSACRFIGNFYWLKVKAHYLKQRLYKGIHRRKLLAEYSLVLGIFALAWGVSGLHFMNDMRIFNKIRGYKLEETTKPFSYDATAAQSTVDVKQLSTIKLLPEAPAQGSYVSVPIEKGDTVRSIAYKAIDQYINGQPDFKDTYPVRMKANEILSQSLTQNGMYISPTSFALIQTTSLERALQTARAGS